jgi:GDP-L-fucose synthase
MNFYKNKKVLVTGGTGLIGTPLVKMLLEKGAKVTVVSLDQNLKKIKDYKFLKLDLREFSNCMKACKNQDYVFHLAGIKGSPLMTKLKPASFLVPTVSFTFNMMEAARRSNVERFLLTSSIGVYSPSRIFKEESVWKTFPSENDKFAGWAKRLCELQAEAYKIQYKSKNISIVRPANVYGPNDNFDINNAMVIPSLINKISNSKKILKVWGDGTPIRDFIYADDVARGMLKIVEKKISYPINLGSGKGVSILNLVNNISNNFEEKKIKIIWQKDKPSGDKVRLMDTTKAQKIGFKPLIPLAEGLRRTIIWYKKNSNNFKKYNSFKEKI